jgi:WhiB family transcriptional regulator, redox-sensing transcriptional regulator
MSSTKQFDGWRSIDMSRTLNLEWVFEPWRQEAACRDLPGGMFFPTGSSTEEEAPARAVCASCPVRAECLEHALKTRTDYGIWGGTNPRERARLRRQRAKGAA